VFALSKYMPSFHLVGLAWRGLCCWFKNYTFAPLWLPERWRRPCVGYFLGAFFVVVAVAIDLVILAFFPAFRMPGLLVILALLLTALFWGAGPSLVATLAGVALVDYFDIAPRMILAKHLADLVVDDFLLIVVGGIISLIAMQVQRARHRAEAMRAEAEKSAERWYALQFISEAALSKQPIDDVLQTVLGRICATLSIEYCAVLLLDEMGQTLTIRAAYGLDPELARQARIPLGQGGSGIIAATGEPLLIPDLAAFGTVYPYFEELFRSFVGVPLHIGKQVIGVLCMTSVLPDHFTLQDVRLLEQLASRLALVIDHARLDEAERQAHHEADTRASQLEAIFESLAEGVMVFDTQGYVVRANEAARYFLGPGSADLDFFNYSVEEWGGIMAVRDEHGNLLSEDRLPVRRALEGEVLTGNQALELIIRRLDGRDVVITSSAAPVYDAEGRIVGAVCTFNDVTERRQLERRTREALRGLLAMAQTLMQAPEEVSPDSEQAMDAYMTVQRLAVLMSQIMGCYRLGVFAFSPDNDSLLPVAVAGLAATGEEPWRFENISQYTEFFACLLEGKPLLWSVYQPPLSYQIPEGIHEVLVVPMRLREQLVGALFLDYGTTDHVYTEEERSLAEGSALLAALVLERERLLHEREEAQASALALREANRKLDEFLGVASHELRTPLTSILLGLQLFRRRSERVLHEEIEVTEELSRKLALLFDQLVITERQTQRLDRLVNDLLDVSRIQTGRLTLHRKIVDLGVVVAETVEEQRQAAPDRAIHLHPPGQPVLLFVDAERIGQVITNYLTNALKYSAEDQPVDIGLLVEANQARVWVRDRGPGLPPGEQEHVWERFHRVPGVEVRSGSGVGLGLGLYISRTIVEAHEGQVGIQSIPGVGTTFWFTLPLPQREQEPGASDQHTNKKMP
jgi:PAS domain S-box-containing protein